MVTSPDPDTDAVTPDGGEAAPSPEFGPAGYLPPRAAKRARKIVLRERMGLGWPVAAVVAGLGILAVVIPLVIGGTAPPAEPFTNAGPIEQVDPLGDAVLSVDGVEVLVVRGGGVLAAFRDPPDGTRFCAESRRLESSAGGVWSLGGRPLSASTTGLVPAGVAAFDDHLYLDVVTPADPVAGPGGDLTPTCA